MRLFIALLFGTTLLLAAPVPKEKAKVKDAEAILGSWKIEAFDTDGAPGAPPKELIDSIRFIFEKEGKMKMTMNVNGMANEQKTEYKLDPEAKIKSIDLTNMGRTAKGIYELDGDSLKLAISEGETSDRPAEFKANKAVRVALVTFKRIAEEKKEDKKDK